MKSKDIHKVIDGHSEDCNFFLTDASITHDECNRDCQFFAPPIIERAPLDRMTAEVTIRRFRKDAQLALTYKATAPNPYKDDDEERIELYADNKGYEYWINPKDDKLIQSGPSTGVHPAAHKVTAETREPIAVLRALAVEIVASQVEGFSEKRAGLHPLEDNRNREIYFFRWDDFSKPAKESELPPFVQVGIYADGKLASFTNTLY